MPVRSFARPTTSWGFQVTVPHGAHGGLLGVVLVSTAASQQGKEHGTGPTAIPGHKLSCRKSAGNRKVCPLYVLST